MSGAAQAKSKQTEYAKKKIALAYAKLDEYWKVNTIFNCYIYIINPVSLLHVYIYYRHKIMKPLLHLFLDMHPVTHAACWYRRHNLIPCMDRDHLNFSGRAYFKYSSNKRSSGNLSTMNGGCPPPPPHIHFIL